MSDEKPKSVLALGAGVVLRSYSQRVIDYIKQWEQQQYLDWRALSPEEQYKRFRAAELGKFKAEAKVRRFINEKHNKIQTLRAYKRRLKELEDQIADHAAEDRFNDFD